MWRCLSTRRPATNSPSMPRRAEFPGPLVSWHTLTGAPATRCSGHPDGGRREPPGVPPHQAPGLHGARPRRVPRRALRSGACFAVVASATLAGRRARTSAQFAHCGGLVCLCACVLVCLCACVLVLCACVHVSACVFCVLVCLCACVCMCLHVCFVCTCTPFPSQTPSLSCPASRDYSPPSCGGVDPFSISFLTAWPR